MPNLAYWLTGAITSLSAQAGAATVNFDIGDVALTWPPHNTADWLPINFAWQGRGVAGDYYAWTTAYEGEEFCWVEPPEASTAFTLDFTAAFGCEMVTFVPFTWYIYVTNGPSYNNGFG